MINYLYSKSKNQFSDELFTCLLTFCFKFSNFTEFLISADHFANTMAAELVDKKNSIFLFFSCLLYWYSYLLNIKWRFYYSLLLGRFLFLKWYPIWHAINFFRSIFQKILDGNINKWSTILILSFVKFNTLLLSIDYFFPQIISVKNNY